jgi:hypothetical protein
MAAIFQIRRGTSNITISDGELYLHKGSGSIQFGSGSTPYNLLPLNAPTKGDIILTGNITASNAYFSGDVAISGNLFLGNASNDTITAGGEFTSNLIPNPTNTYTLGSSTKIWKEVHATSISGAIAATNGVISGSSQIIQSLPSGLVSGSSQINFTQIGGISNDIVSASTDSTNIDFTITNGNISANLKGGVVSGSSQIASVLDSLNQFSSSINTATASLNLTTASLNAFTQSASNRLSRLEESTSSLNSYTSSLKTAITVDGVNTTILGNLSVLGVTTTVHSNEVNIGDNIIQLNYGYSAIEAGIEVTDVTGGSVLSGSLLWDGTTDYWKAGKKGIESKILLAGGDGILSSSAQLVELNSFTQSSNLRLNNLESKSSSVDISIVNLNIVSSSINNFTASASNRLNNLESKSASVDTIVSNLQISSSNLNIVSASLNSYTASNDITNTNQNNRLSRLEESTSSLNTFTASVTGHISDINAWTGSQKEKDTTLENVTSSLNLITASFNTWTGSTYNTFSTSVDSRLDNVEYTVTVLDPGNIGNALLGINAFTESANSRLNNLEATTSSLNSFSSSINNTIKTKLDTDSVISGSSQVSYVGLSNIPSGIISSSTQIDTLFNIDGLVSGSSQIIPLLPVGTVSGSSQVSYNGLSNIPSGIISSSAQIDALFNVDGLVSGSSQIDATATTNWATGIKTQLNSNTVISGSSQVSYNGLSNIPAGIISSSAQIDTLFNIDGLVSGSSQVSYVGLSNIPGGIVSGSSQVSYTALSNIPGGIVSGSIQILGGSNILSGSNQTNITSINQNLGTSTTGVQFASLGIGTAPDATYELKIEGDIAASGDIVAYYTSDKRLKDNIQPIQNALDKVNELGGYTFDWNEELQKARKGHDIGVIAQEVQSVLPEVVVERDNGYLGVDYQKLVPVLIEAIKELSEKVKLLENK